MLSVIVLNVVMLSVVALLITTAKSCIEKALNVFLGLFLLSKMFYKFGLKATR
jgi:hypothetical protein